MRSFLAALIAYVGSRATFKLIDFKYAIFTDHFDVKNVAIDLGVFCAIYIAAFWLLARLFTSRKKT